MTNTETGTPRATSDVEQAFDHLVDAVKAFIALHPTDRHAYTGRPLGIETLEDELNYATWVSKGCPS